MGRAAEGDWQVSRRAARVCAARPAGRCWRGGLDDGQFGGRREDGGGAFAGRAADGPAGYGPVRDRPSPTELQGPGAEDLQVAPHPTVHRHLPGSGEGCSRPAADHRQGMLPSRREQGLRFHEATLVGGVCRGPQSDHPRAHSLLARAETPASGPGSGTSPLRIHRSPCPRR